MTGYLSSFEPAMRRAITEAAAAASGLTGDSGDAGRIAADVPVGAVVLDGSGEIVATGRNQREADADPTAHAEVVALRAAGRARASWRLDGFTLVVTLEPCTMCAGALLASRLARLVYGAADPHAGAAGSVWDVLNDPRLGRPVEIVSGVLADDCAALLRDFFGERR
jgi:tRNA(adenine34) deaminase